MSDFIFSSLPKPKGMITEHIGSIYHCASPKVYEFHGPWGSLGVSHNLYNGFQPLETQQHIFIVIGGPVLCFRNNRFLTESDPIEGSKSIYDRWLTGTIKWDEDLSGPFAVLIVNKESKQVTYITDLLSFIPVYRYDQGDNLMLGTHVDALAKTSGQANLWDTASLADFILNDVVTYPHTVYQNISQTPPATITIEEAGGIRCTDTYWLPTEDNPYNNINEAAVALRKGVQDYVNKITENMQQVAQFVSGGEDSRVILGLMPRRLERDAFIFLDGMNREGNIAQKAVNCYGAKIHVGYRSPTHYLNILEEASDLIGSGHQYTHAHSLKFHRTCGLQKYHAVFGGYLADSLLKAMFSRQMRGNVRFPFLPEFVISGETRTKPITNPLFSEKTLEIINNRRFKHMETVRNFRPTTAHEWFVLWPATMRTAIPNVYTNRRLFCSYEIFLCKDAVKIGTAIPTGWKLNRRLFNKAMRPYLKPTRRLLSADGRLPYFPWWVNVPIQFIVWAWHHIAGLLGIVKGNQGPWFEWAHIVDSQKWHNLISEYSTSSTHVNLFANTESLEAVFKTNHLTEVQKLNLLQMLYKLKG